jgi:hypothetical protein
LHPHFSWVRVTRSLVLCVYFVDRCLSFWPLFFGHCVVCPITIYGFWLPLWSLETLFNLNKSNNLLKEYMTNNKTLDRKVKLVGHIYCRILLIERTNLWVIVIGDSNMTSFCRFVNKRASYPFGIISLAHALVNVTDFSIGNINCVRHFPPA